MIIKPFWAFLLLTGLALSSAEYTPKDEDECNGPNEFYDCHSSTPECQRMCKHKDKKVICFFDCQPACVCKSGYYRLGDNDRSKCVLKKDCPGKKATTIKKLIKPTPTKQPIKQTTKPTAKKTQG